MYPVTTGVTFAVEATVSGTGGFDGATERGRASVTIPGPISSGNVIVRAKRYGVLANAYTIQFVDPGAGQTNPVTTVSQIGTAIFVRLRRNSGGILATADEVARAINAFGDYTFPISADAVSSSPTVVQAVATTPLAGGLDPFSIDLAGRIFYSKFTNQNVGVFYFENTFDAVQIRKVQCNFVVGGACKLKIETVAMTPGLGLDTTRKGPVLEADISPSTPDFGITDIRDPLLPYQALLVRCLDGSSNPQPGFVRVEARREANYPFA